MNPTIVAGTAVRVLQQLRGDPRTVALLLVVPAVLLTVVRFVVNDDGPVFDRFGLPLLGIFPLILMFAVTSIAMLRERTSGTLERLLSMPLAKLDLLVGYALAFGAIAVVQAVLLVAVGVALLGLDVAGPLWAVVVLTVANGVLGMAMGLLLSAFATTEFQAMQFMPAFVIPQLLLCGLVVARADMAQPLYWVSWAMPMTYAFNGLDELRATATLDGQVIGDLAIVGAITLAALALGAVTLRRRTP